MMGTSGRMREQEFSGCHDLWGTANWPTQVQTPLSAFWVIEYHSRQDSVSRWNRERWTLYIQHSQRGGVSDNSSRGTAREPEPAWHQPGAQAVVWGYWEESHTLQFLHGEGGRLHLLSRILLRGCWFALPANTGFEPECRALVAPIPIPGTCRCWELKLVHWQAWNPSSSPSS